MSDITTKTKKPDTTRVAHAGGPLFQQSVFNKPTVPYDQEAFHACLVTNLAGVDQHSAFLDEGYTVLEKISDNRWWMIIPMDRYIASIHLPGNNQQYLASGESGVTVRGGIATPDQLAASEPEVLDIYNG